MSFNKAQRTAVLSRCIVIHKRLFSY